MKDKFALTRGWIAKARSDLSTAKKLSQSDGPYDTACFHAQQAIEKLLKSFLAFNEKSIPKTHDLDELQKLCLEIKEMRDLASLDFAETTGYAVEMRYDLEFWPDRVVAEEAVNLAEKVYDIILNFLPAQCSP